MGHIVLNILQMTIINQLRCSVAPGQYNRFLISIQRTCCCFFTCLHTFENLNNNCAKIGRISQIFGFNSLADFSLYTIWIFSTVIIYGKLCWAEHTQVCSTRGIWNSNCAATIYLPTRETLHNHLHSLYHIIPLYIKYFR